MPRRGCGGAYGSRCQIYSAITLNQTSFVNGDTVTATTLRFANAGTTPVAVEIKLWLEEPGVAPISVVNLGADGSLSLPALFDQDFGPLALSTVTSTFPRGTYGFNCRILRPVTGGLQGEALTSFSVQ